MSYCRWSTDNFSCDIYAYESERGFEIHVASNKIIGEVPEGGDTSSLMRGEEGLVLKFVEAENKRHEWLINCERKPLGLPYDGKSFTCETLEDFRDKMLELRKIGYRFPDYVLTDIEEEIKTQKL